MNENAASVAEMAIDEMIFDKMIVDKMTVDKMKCLSAAFDRERLI
jgi:hypothetical protein